MAFSKIVLVDLLQCLHNKLLEHMHNLHIKDCYEILAHIAFWHIIAQMPLVMWT